MFYEPGLSADLKNITLGDDTSKHIGQVLRMLRGEEIVLTDGRGLTAACTLEEVTKKKVVALVRQTQLLPQPAPRMNLAVAFTRNASRNEWLLEKATELGVAGITPLITARSTRDRIRIDRWQAILISAMLQSRQSWLPVLHPSTAFDALIPVVSTPLIAHCMDDEPRMPITEALKPGTDSHFFIGPEGDFTAAEVSLARAHGAVAVSLGPNRLRTETAALAVMTQFYLINHAV